MDTASVTEIPEDELTSWLFLQSLVIGQVIWEFDLPSPPAIDLQVPTTRISPSATGPGDIDVLLANQARPQEAVAIEVKRVKVGPRTFHTRMPGKLQGLRQGVRQANLLSDITFFRTMLLLLVVTSGREREEFNFASRGLTWDLARLIDDFPHRERLSSRVDIGVVEITQPVDKSIFDAGCVGLRIVHSGVRSQQPRTLTDAICRHFSFEGHGGAA